VSDLPFDGHGDDGNEAGCRQLLEMHEVRRGVERRAVANGSVRLASMAVTRVHKATLIAQLERRMAK
jgi:hypothetical protein